MWRDRERAPLSATPPPRLRPNGLSPGAPMFPVWEALQQRSRGPRPEVVRRAVNEHRQEEVDDQDRDERDHERLGRGSAHSLGDGAAIEAAVATNERD